MSANAVKTWGLRLVAILLLSILIAPAARASCGTESVRSFGQSAHVTEIINLMRNNWVKGLMSMTQQFATTIMQQSFAIGAFLDAKHQLETQRLMQQMTAQAHSAYHPDVQLCRYGTNTRSLGASDIKSKVNAQILNHILQERETLKDGTASQLGPYDDLQNRLKNFREIYCDPNENNANFKNASDGSEEFCKSSTPTDRVNKDIDYGKTVDGRYTINADFTNTARTNDEVDILALSKNLFAHEIFPFNEENLVSKADNESEILSLRSIYAVRGVARNSFAQIVGMRSRGTPESAAFMKKVMEELGVPDDETTQFLGENPSYFAQMEVLTRKMIQNPAFFTNLYTTPENVKRAGVTMQALGLIQDRDRYDSALRREMLISLILEMKLREVQEVVESNVRGDIPSVFQGQ